jgi:spermidine synthase
MRYRLLFAINFVLAFCSIGYEFAIARTLTEMTGRGSQAQALTVAFYILGLGIGANFARATGPQVFRHLIQVEIGLALLGAVSIGLIQILHIITYVNSVPDIWFLVIAQLVSLLVGSLSGLELPYMLSLSRSSSGEKRTLGILGLNYLGAMLSAVTCIYLFFPKFSGSQIVYAFAGMNLMAALVLLLMYQGKKSILQISISIAALILAGYAQILAAVDLKYLQYFYSVQIQVDAFDSLAEKFASLDESVGVERIRTPYQVIDFVQRRFPEVQDEHLKFRWADYVYINGQVQIQIGGSKVYHELMAHVPIALAQKVPERVLILGGGDGLLAKELLRHSSVASIKLIEIDAEIIKLSSTRKDLSDANSHIFNNPKVMVAINDAYVFVRQEGEQYDAVYIDLPFPFDEDLNKLYGFEFYANVLKLLKSEGFVVIDYPLSKSKRIQETIFQTLKKAGFDNILGFGDKTNFVAASRNPQKLSGDHVHEFISEHSREYNVVYPAMFSEIKIDPAKANSALRPLLVGH